MRKIECTCPFTGVDFEAMEYDDGSMLITHPITSEQVKIHKSLAFGGFVVPFHMFAKQDTVTMTQAAEMLDVSRQRISQIVKNDVIPYKTVDGSVVFIRDDVLEYKQNRKVGAPFKSKD